VSFDPFLYLALAAGFLVGRFVRVPSRWVRRGSIATVLVLVGLLGGSIAPLPVGVVTRAIPVALAFTLVILGFTTVALFLLARRAPTATRRPSPSDRRSSVRVSLTILAALLVGYALGRLTSVAFASVHLYYATTYGAAAPIIFPTLFLTGFAFATTYRYTGGNLAVPAVLHGAHDAAAFLDLIVSPVGTVVGYLLIFVGAVIALAQYGEHGTLAPPEAETAGPPR
jgi:hypothetical protein